MAIMKRKQKVSDEIPTSSMADIAFLLLVFFLTTTVFNEERGLPIVLPEQSEEMDVSGRNLIFFIVQPDGRVVVRRGESEQEQVVAHTQVANILFLLLVFFLTTTVFNEERGLPIVLPEQSEEMDVSGRNLIFFIVQPDGRVVVRRGESEQEQVVAHTQVANILRTELAGNANLIAAIQTHPDAAYRHMVNVLDEVKLSGAERISLQEMEN
jgi:biopolymer transport protein ExbD